MEWESPLVFIGKLRELNTGHFDAVGVRFHEHQRVGANVNDREGDQQRKTQQRPSPSMLHDGTMFAGIGPSVIVPRLLAVLPNTVRPGVSSPRRWDDAENATARHDGHDASRVVPPPQPMLQSQSVTAR
jgi:hypothetical protein